MTTNLSTKYNKDNENPMPTLDVIDAKAAAKLLCAHVQTICLKAKKGEIPGRKVGRGWVFSVLALQRYLDGQFSPRVMQGDQLQGGKTCRSTNEEAKATKAKAFTTNSTAPKLEKLYREALAPQTKLKRKNSTIA